jgi:hypothetical protein
MAIAASTHPSEARAVEVTVLWGSVVLGVWQLTKPRGFQVGEAPGSDFVMPAESIGASRLPIVAWSGARWLLVLPGAARGYVDLPTEPRMTLEEVRRCGRPSLERDGDHHIPLTAGTRARLEIGEFAIQVAAMNRGRSGHGSVEVDWRLFGYFAVSVLAHVGLLAAMAFCAPPLGLNDGETADQDRWRLIHQYLGAAAERERGAWNPDAIPVNVDQHEGGTGTRTQGEEGSMGHWIAATRSRRYALQGPSANPDPHVARSVALREAADFGMIGLLESSVGEGLNAPIAPWGRFSSRGTERFSANGSLWGNAIGDAFDAGGLGLSGIGEGGGGRGEGIGLAAIGTLGHGAGTGTGQGFGPGSGWLTFGCGCGNGYGSETTGRGRVGGSHRARAPELRTAAISVSGRLPPEAIQRVVRQNHGRLTACYQEGLGRNPTLEGRVSVRFVIAREGSVASAANGGSDLPDSKVVDCVVRAYYGLSFPPPEGGIVTVVYPILFLPG